MGQAWDSFGTEAGLMCEKHSHSQRLTAWLVQIKELLRIFASFSHSHGGTQNRFFKGEQSASFCKIL